MSFRPWRNARRVRQYVRTPLVGADIARTSQNDVNDPTETWAGSRSARHRVDHGTICGRNCAYSRHYKPLRACVHRIFDSSRRRPEKIIAPKSWLGKLDAAGHPRPQVSDGHITGRLRVIKATSGISFYEFRHSRILHKWLCVWKVLNPRGCARGVASDRPRIYANVLSPRFIFDRCC